MIKKLLAGIIGLSGVGLIDTFYLTYQHYAANSLACNLLEGCDLVTKSAYNNLAGVPIALLGFFYYISIFALAIYLYRHSSPLILKNPIWTLFSLTTTGLVFSAWLTYLQAAVIKAWCQYCLLSASLTLIIFIISLFLLKLSRQVITEGSPRSEESAV